MHHKRAKFILHFIREAVDRMKSENEKLLIEANRITGQVILEKTLQKIKLNPHTCDSREMNLVVYEDLQLDYYDNVTIPYNADLADTNALIMDDSNRICGILNIVAKAGDTTNLYLKKSAKLFCKETETKSYRLFCFNQNSSQLIYKIYMGYPVFIPKSLDVYQFPIQKFHVKKPNMLTMPVLIRIGSESTRVSTYLPTSYFKENNIAFNGIHTEKDGMNDVLYYDCRGNQYVVSNRLPNVAGVLSMNEGKGQYVFGYDALKHAENENAEKDWLFYDIGTWMNEYETVKEHIDKSGKKIIVRKKEVLKGFLEYIIDITRNQFKCMIERIYVIREEEPKMLQPMLEDILPAYSVTCDGSVIRKNAV